MKRILDEQKPEAA
jgi:hypothetical protein